MTQNLGKISTYMVSRPTDIGYMLKQGADEYFLHNNECSGQFFKPGDQVTCFLYQDKQHRLALTTVLPNITVDRSGWAEVVGESSAGVYLDIGISKDLLWSNDGYEVQYQPRIGSKLYGYLAVIKDKLQFRIAYKDMLHHGLPGEHLTPGELPLKEPAEAVIYRITNAGLNVVADNRATAFIPYSQSHHYRIGDQVVIIPDELQDNDYLARLMVSKRHQLASDAELVFNVLKNNKGKLYVHDKSDPETIKRLFGLSKSRFKAAIGHLYKNNLIEITSDAIIEQPQGKQR